jgi:hypothetical protein
MDFVVTPRLRDEEDDDHSRGKKKKKKKKKPTKKTNEKWERAWYSFSLSLSLLRTHAFSRKRGKGSLECETLKEFDI